MVAHADWPGARGEFLPPPTPATIGFWEAMDPTRTDFNSSHAVRFIDTVRLAAVPVVARPVALLQWYDVLPYSHFMLSRALACADHEALTAVD